MPQVSCEEQLEGGRGGVGGLGYQWGTSQHELNRYVYHQRAEFSSPFG